MTPTKSPEVAEPLSESIEVWTVPQWRGWQGLAAEATPTGVTHRLALNDRDGDTLESEHGIWRLPEGRRLQWRKAVSEARQADGKDLRLLVVPSQDIQALWIPVNGGTDLILPITGSIESIGAKPSYRDKKERPLVEQLSPWAGGSRSFRSQLDQRKWLALTICTVALLTGLYLYDRSSPIASGVFIDLESDWMWFEVMIVALGLGLGKMASGRIDGVFIDERNRISLARVQAFTWFTLIVGLYLFELMWNVSHAFLPPVGNADLWKLVGITSATPIVSNTILSAKANAPSETDRTSMSTSFDLPIPTPPPGQGTRVGKLDRNIETNEASWSDIYLGEEVGSQCSVDVTRFQQFLATIGFAVAFANLAAAKLEKVNGALGMPQIGPNFVWLIGLTTGAYLIGKAAPKTGS